MTTYHVAYLVHHSTERTASFSSMLERALFIISITPYAAIVREWME